MLNLRRLRLIETVDRTGKKLRHGVWAALLFGITLLVACDGDSTTEAGTGELIGTWVLVSVDDVEAPPGTLTWTISLTTITAESGPPDPCIEVGTYTVSGSMITATTTSVSGSGCGSEIGDTITFTFDVSGDTLTAVFSDPDLGTATFVFNRA